jgi:two-component system osmolarity sensor histidine kinase EnvZ
MTPRTLFGRMALVIALVSIAFQGFTIAVIGFFALVPLGRLATDDLSRLMVGAAQSWRSAGEAGRAKLQEQLMRQARLQVQEPSLELAGSTHWLPYFRLLETSLAERSGRPVALARSPGPDGQPWYWADLPTDGAPVRVGFAADRVSVQPSLALILVLGVGTVVTLITAALMARWLVAPLARLAAATQPIGQGRRPALLAETGPDELAVLAREFNRMGAQVEELLANRTTLLAGISHDLRSPLTRIRLALGMLSEKPDADLLQRIVRDVDVMNDLIARCLEVGSDFSERESIDMNLCDLLAQVAREHDHSGVEIRGHRGPDCHLRARPLALKRILSNLVDNAIRYGAGQPVEIEFRIEGDDVEICVLDRGPGIPHDSREAVFRPFHRLEASRSSRTGGSGLGLAIVRQIAAANGWVVELRPRPGGGTAACLRMPLEDNAAFGHSRARARLVSAPLTHR